MPTNTADTDAVCGEPTDTGTPCQRDAGWGRGPENHDGPCKDHLDSYNNPTKLTPEVKNQLVGAAQEGAFKEHCAQIAGVTEQTLRNWMNWGKADLERDVDSPCADLFLDFERARGAGAIRRLKDAPSEFVLSRSYGYTKREEHNVNMDANVEQTTSHELGDADRELALETIRQLQANDAEDSA